MVGGGGDPPHSPHGAQRWQAAVAAGGGTQGTGARQWGTVARPCCREASAL